LIEVRTAGQLGYCSGVSQAIEKAVKHSAEHGPIYSLGTIAHNEDVVAYLLAHNVKPITMQEVTTGMNVAITAHGAPQATFKHLEDMGCQVLNCTCPIVRKAQLVVSQKLDGFDIVIFGDPEHQEVIGLNGWANGAKFVGNFNDLFTPSLDHKSLMLGPKVGVISQTTKIPSQFADFVATLLHNHINGFKELRVFNTICPIVSARVNETRQLSDEVDMMFVVGSQESANTRNLEAVCRQSITRVRGMVEPWAVTLVQNVDQVEEALSDWFTENEMTFPRVGVTGGTSTPIEVVEEIVTKLKELLYERENSD